MTYTSKQIAILFKALSDENRIEVLKLLQQGERCICTILEEMDISQSTLSHHMKVLLDAGYVNSRKDGKWTHYSIRRENVAEIQNIMNDFKVSGSTMNKKC